MYKINNDCIFLIADAERVGKQIDKCLSKKALPPVDIAYNFVKCYNKVKTNYTLVSIIY